MIGREGPLILAVETATRDGSVSLAAGAKILCSSAGDPAASHSTNLLANISELLRIADLSLNDVDCFAAAVGPGSFTGLRIGLATIKAFAVCFNRKCVGVSTLAAIAHATGRSGQIVSLLPAGRGEVFAQLFGANEDRAIEPADEAAHLSPGAVLEKYGRRRRLIWTGEGSQVHADMLRRWAEHHNIIFVESNKEGYEFPGNSDARWTLTPQHGKLAESVSALALRAYDQGRLIRPERLQAIYVRPSDAETNEQCHEQKPQSVTRR